ncbi:hypothetical protein ACFW04_014422 [Cataglyphis niger]
MTQIQTIYKPTNRRRGLIEGLGSIAKSLFGTNDANDEKYINEQLDLLNRKQIIQHVAKNQIKILNNTTAHIEQVEDIINWNEKLLQQRVTVYTERAEINAHFIIITAVIAKLIRDAENYFPFKIHAKDWLAIDEHTTISAFYDKRNVYTILQFPLITQPSCDIIKIITLPVPIHNNTFIVTQINNNIFAVDKEKLTYLRVTENDLRNCIKQNAKYTCENAILIYSHESKRVARDTTIYTVKTT